MYRLKVVRSFRPNDLGVELRPVRFPSEQVHFNARKCLPGCLVTCDDEQAVELLIADGLCELAKGSR